MFRPSERLLTSPKLIIEGGRPLEGTVRVGGSKNAADYAIAACLLTGEECVLENVPDIEDVRVMTSILSALGAEVRNEGRGVLHIRAANIDRFEAPSDLVVRQRASFLVMGPLLGRFGQAACTSPGGDVIGSRPLDVHLEGFRALGADVTRRAELHFAEKRDREPLAAGRLFLDYPSVTGTVNLIFAAALARGRTTIINAACEPEIVDVARLLIAMGARIEGAGNSIIEIDGVEELHGARYALIPDRLETGFFALAAAITRGDVTIEDTNPAILDALIHKMREAGATIETGESTLRVCGKGREFKSVQAQAVPYPGLATDLHPTLAAFLTQCQGVSVIQERVYENRFLYVAELRKMGADVITAGSTAIISGRTPLYGTVVRALDVRAGGALVLAGLAAEGNTEILDVHHIERAYEDIGGKLRGLGARVSL
ncbi:MAG TPA: UDP-N-acetylglucosamine 1-carboxyvinyltransferase [Dehalococcoidia bacterium]|nr:UDP-N-acetylglucosamine 1-carboxyvinyltransferase [Dehalococcoidia bacterium]